MITTSVQRNSKSGQLTITIPKDFAALNKIDKGVKFEFVSCSGKIHLESGDVVLKRKME